MSFFYSSDDDDPKRAARRPLLAFILVTLAIGAGASVFTEPSIPTWYAALSHPAITPPNWVFAPVWTTLYIVMAVAAWRVWRITGIRSIEMAAYAVQIVLNFGWSWIFFSLHRPAAAFAEILALDAAILFAAILFFRRDRIAGLLFLPYLAWTGFASLLTYDFWTLNPVY
jgi:tryptophan-rich sensory protein